MTKYIKSHANVTIMCPKHGYFTLRAGHHLSGQGCQECFWESKRRDVSDLIDEFNAIHNNKYDYSKVEYHGTHSNISVICPIHGAFEISPCSHLRGNGCRKCARELRMAKNKVYGVGINDVFDSAHKPYQRFWARMHERCYDPKFTSKEPSYIGCSVCDEWHYLSNFKRWFDDPKNGYQEGYQLDKDILVKGNKVYGPDTCCFVPQRINTLLLTCKAKRGNYPVGVSKVRGSYSCHISLNGYKWHGGYFSTPEEAFATYKTAKEAYIKEVATSYYNEGKITEKVYNALMNYQVEITD